MITLLTFIGLCFILLIFIINILLIIKYYKIIKILIRNFNSDINYYLSFNSKIKNFFLKFLILINIIFILLFCSLYVNSWYEQIYYYFENSKLVYKIITMAYHIDYHIFIKMQQEVTQEYETLIISCKKLNQPISLTTHLYFMLKKKFCYIQYLFLIIKTHFKL